MVAIAVCLIAARVVPPSPPTTSSNCSSLSSTYVNSFFITGFSFSLLTNVVLAPVHNQVTGYPHCEHSHHSSHLTWITRSQRHTSVLHSPYRLLCVILLSCRINRHTTFPLPCCI